MKKVLIAMSGGVDSSVAAILLKNNGYDCIGATMRLCSDTVKDKSITDADIHDAKAVADFVGIPFNAVDFTEDFEKNVIDKFIKSYINGATPNPCIDCNRYMKFGKFFDYAKSLGVDLVATGHYAKIEFDKNSNRYLLKKAADPSKDQSYVLYSLSQEILAHTLFPLGGYTKDEIREFALQCGIINAHKSDSQDICFVPDGKYSEFIENYSGMNFPAGNFVDVSGNILGKHNGIIRYTIGQRKGLGLAHNVPMYVCEKNIKDNTVVLTEGKELYSSSLDAADINLISIDKINEPMRVYAKVRYNQKEQPATVWQTDDNTIHVEFDEPQRAITKGQAVVLYSGDIVVGGGTII